MLVRHGQELRCDKCDGEVEAVPHNDQGESRFGFAVTKRRNGTAVDPPFLATIEAAKCITCSSYSAFVDSLVDNDEEAKLWESLPKWHGAEPDVDQLMH